jgi:hypothetical protein
VLEAGRLLLGHEELDIRAQRSLIGFQGQHGQQTEDQNLLQWIVDLPLLARV